MSGTAGATKKRPMFKWFSRLVGVCDILFCDQFEFPIVPPCLQHLLQIYFGGELMETLWVIACHSAIAKGPTAQSPPWGLATPQPDQPVPCSDGFGDEGAMTFGYIQW